MKEVLEGKTYQSGIGLSTVSEEDVDYLAAGGSLQKPTLSTGSTEDVVVFDLEPRYLFYIFVCV